MTHTPETRRAAEQHAMFHIHPDTSADSFLAGYDHRQKEIDELYRHLKDTTRILESYNQDDERVKYNKILIQKHKR